MIDAPFAQRLAGQFCELELQDGFRAFVWVNAVDLSFAGREFNVDVITVLDPAGRSERDIPFEAPLLIGLSEIRAAHLSSSGDVA